MAEINSSLHFFNDHEMGATEPVRPRTGAISRDRVAISGSRGYVDLFEGGNFYYRRYLHKSSYGVGNRLANELSELRSKILSTKSNFIFMCIPNKATCLSENYPLWLPTRPTPVFNDIDAILGQYAGNLFCRWMRTGSFEDRKQFWFETDSHWNSFGAWSAAREVANVLAVRFGSPSHIIIDNTWGGDLSGRWDGVFLSESRHRLYGHDALRKLVFDNGLGAEHSAHMGRYLLWENSAALVDQSVAIVGDSFSGVGSSPEHLTYWLSLLFSKTYFFHGASFPVDFLERCNANFYVFQTNERFLPVAPFSENSLSYFENKFSERLQDEKQ